MAPASNTSFQAGEEECLEERQSSEERERLKPSVSDIKFDNTVFVAGNISNCLPAWENITSDPYILDIVKGLKIPFIRIPYQVCEPFSIPFSESETEIIDDQIQKFLSKGILSVTETEQNEYISNIFVRPKRNGKFRMILNLRAFNEFVEYERFKMDSIHTCVALMK